eukprot:2882183-Rhodomonas_salina.1
MLYPRKKQNVLSPEPNRKVLTINKARIESMFHMPIKDAADQLDICVTSLKRVCRSLGINKWPYVKVSCKKPEDSPEHEAFAFPHQATDASQASTPPPVSPWSEQEEAIEIGNSVVSGACLEQGEPAPLFSFSPFELESDLVVDPSFVYDFMSRNEL